LHPGLGRDTDPVPTRGLTGVRVVRSTLSHEIEPYLVAAKVGRPRAGGILRTAETIESKVELRVLVRAVRDGHVRTIHIHVRWKADLPDGGGDEGDERHCSGTVRGRLSRALTLPF
jgi:hypothetical protein